MSTIIGKLFNHNDNTYPISYLDSFFIRRSRSCLLLNTVCQLPRSDTVRRAAICQYPLLQFYRSKGIGWLGIGFFLYITTRRFAQFYVYFFRKLVSFGDLIFVHTSIIPNWYWYQNFIVHLNQWVLKIHLKSQCHFKQIRDQTLRLLNRRLFSIVVDLYMFPS